MTERLAVITSRQLHEFSQNRPPFGFALAVPSDNRLPEKIDDVIYGVEQGGEILVLQHLSNCVTQQDKPFSRIVGDPANSVVFECDLARNRVPKISLGHALDYTKGVNVMNIPEDAWAQYLEEENRSYNYTFGAIPANVIQTARKSLPRTLNSIAELRNRIEASLRTNYFAFEVHGQRGASGTTPFEQVANQLGHKFIEDKLVRIAQVELSMPQIDLNQIEATAANITTREFSTFSQAENSLHLDLLQSAEIDHQRIVLDCANWIFQNGVKPMMTRSIDLIFESGGTTVFIEVKSATERNFNSQFESGILQLLRYRWQSEGRFSPLALKLVMQAAPGHRNVGTFHFYAEFAESIGVELLLWDDKLEWPARCPDLMATSLNWID